MTVEPNYLSGGDAPILASFKPQEITASEGDSVNELIMKCSDSKECLEKLYLMFKGSVFAIDRYKLSLL